MKKLIYSSFQLIITVFLIGAISTGGKIYSQSGNNPVLEFCTGTWCQYCPGAAMGADDLVTNHNRAAIVEYHNGDAYANTFSDARNTYYATTGYPTNARICSTALPEPHEPLWNRNTTNNANFGLL